MGPSVNSVSDAPAVGNHWGVKTPLGTYDAMNRFGAAPPSARAWSARRGRATAMPPAPRNTTRRESFFIAPPPPAASGTCHS
jgi:hypothetical protein